MYSLDQFYDGQGADIVKGSKEKSLLPLEDLLHLDNNKNSQGNNDNDSFNERNCHHLESFQNLEHHHQQFYHQRPLLSKGPHSNIEMPVISHRYYRISLPVAVIQLDRLGRGL